MMKLALVATMLVAAAYAQLPQQPIPILRLESQIQPDGKFQYLYETGNGIQAQAVGDQKPAGRDGPIQSVQGQYAFTADDGTPVQISYIADENGYQPQGAILPTPPPIPEAILRSLEFIARNAPQK
ncbi:Endocuticle structural glycoprotein SgAbd-2 [Frankliniella fusca]|uniref:Endocuticle structural glycoprotein SgAbd-2 n=2 Tax=Arthropoda TaxID=6656 RepID=A0AAE1LEQ8_9NEOP|nr:Endocuticle structural glycoprotein SgAbd-2 [Frankliniella fusca]